MEIKEGNYIRTRKGITKILEDCGDLLIVDKNGTIHSDCNFNEYVKREDIWDAKESIIDLIRIGDYINGNKVIRIETSSYLEDKNVKIIVCCGDDDYYSYYNEDIKSIVTKEQFENMEYNVSNN